MRKTKIFLSFLTVVSAGVFSAIIYVFKKGRAFGRKTTGKTTDLTDPENKSFNEFIAHIKNVRSGIEESAEDLKNRAAIKMKSLRADFKTVFGIPVP